MNSITINEVFKIIRRISVRMIPYSRSYARVCGVGLVVALLEVLPPRLVGMVVDRVTRGSIQMSFVFGLATIWSINTGVVQLLHSAQIRVASRSGEEILANLRKDIFSLLQQLSMGFFNRTHIGQIISIVGNDLDSLRNFLIWGLNTLFANTVTMLFSASMLLFTDLNLFLSVVWLIPTMTLLNLVYGRKITLAWKNVAIHSSQVGANQAENIAGARVVAAYNRQEQNLARYNELQRINTRNNVAASKLNGTLQPWIQWVRFSGQAILLIYGGYRVAKGSLATGDLVAVILYWEWIMQPAINFGVFFSDLFIAASGAQRVLQLLDEKPEIVDAPNAVELPKIRGHVQFENISFCYRPNQLVLDQFNLDVPAGTVVALIGTTGSGKSTLLSLLARFYQPNQGRVLIDGYDLRFVQGKSLQNQIAMVPQHNYLFTGTVMDNLRYVRPEASDEDIFDAASALGCHNRFLQLKQGYLTQVGERGSALSLGERQLICFTRALVSKPRIILLDEATSAIDPVTELQVQNALAKLIQGRTTFIVAHRLSTIIHADLILVIDQGKIVEKGPHFELLSLGKKYAQFHSYHGLSRYTHC